MTETISSVLITGGTGMIGRLLTPEFQAAGIETWILTRRPEMEKAVPGAKLLQWDGQTPAGWQHLVERVDAIINLAGENTGTSPWTNERRRQLVDSRVFAGQALTTAIRAASSRPKVLLQISGVGYYGPSDDRLIREYAPPGKGFQAEICVQWEESTREVEGLGVRRVVMRTAPVLSRSEGMLPRLELPFRLLVGGPLGSGKQWLPWIHHQDLVRGMRFLMENETVAGPVNLTSPNPLTSAEFGRTLARVIHRPYWMPAPAFALRMVLGKMSALVLEGQRVVPDRLEKLGFKFDYGDAQKALEEIYS